MIGVDEVGRGAWAGPLLVCAARLKPGKRHVRSLTDSKQLSKTQRNHLFEKILKRYDLGEGWVSAGMIDELGLSKALSCGALLALLQIGTNASEKIVIDGKVNLIKHSSFRNVTMKIKADESIAEVSAASIYAKVMRDGLMHELAEEYPAYGWQTNVGYGTRSHRKAIKIHGLNKFHRTSFKIPSI